MYVHIFWKSLPFIPMSAHNLKSVTDCDRLGMCLYSQLTCSQPCKVSGVTLCSPMQNMEILLEFLFMYFHLHLTYLSNLCLRNQSSFKLTNNTKDHISQSFQVFSKKIRGDKSSWFSPSWPAPEWNSSWKRWEQKTEG